VALTDVVSIFKANMIHIAVSLYKKKEEIGLNFWHLRFPYFFGFLSGVNDRGGGLNCDLGLFYQILYGCCISDFLVHHT